MDIQIEMSAAQWHSLLGYLDPNSSAFSIVKSAIEINEAPITTPLARVILTCDENDAKVMLHAAQRFFPEIAPGIMTALESRQR
jgi:uncharacterized membrane-anchored protein